MMMGIVGDTQDTWRAHRAKAFRGDLPGIDSIRRTAINYHMDMKSRVRKVEGGERSFSSVSGRGMAAMSRCLKVTEGLLPQGERTLQER